MTTPAPHQAGRIVLRPLGSPLPLGFLALMTGSLVLSALQLRWVPVTQSAAVALAVLLFTVPLQAVACVFGLLARDPVCATGTGVLFGVWAVTGVSLLLSAPGRVSAGLGMLLVVAAAALLLPTATAAAGKVVAAVIFAAAAVRFGFSGAYELTGSPGWQQAAGIAGLVVGVVAAYGAVAFELESAFGRTVLPVLRLGRGRLAMSGRLDDQFAAATREAGVRQQL